MCVLYISTCNLHRSDSRAGISNLTFSLSAHRAATQIRVMIIWWWMRLVGGHRPLLASLHRFHLHTSCKHILQDHLNNDNNNNNNNPSLHLCLPLFHNIHNHEVHACTHLTEVHVLCTLMYNSVGMSVEVLLVL